MLHLHDLNHVQINGLALAVDCENRVDDSLGQCIGQCTVHLGAQRRAGDRDEQFAIHLRLGGLEVFQELRATVRKCAFTVANRVTLP